jgi:hypothetical protein
MVLSGLGIPEAVVGMGGGVTDSLYIKTNKPLKNRNREIIKITNAPLSI